MSDDTMVSRTLLVDFSRNLLVTIFAIFAFTSGPLLSSNNFWVKSIYLGSLALSIISLRYGYKGMLTQLNFYMTYGKEGKSLHFPEHKLNEMKLSIERQFHFSIAALSFLAFSVFVHFFYSDNFITVLLKK